MGTALAIILVLLNVADVFLTNAALKNRSHEANPVQAWLMERLGSWWWLSKLVLALPIWAAFHATTWVAVLLLNGLIAVYVYVVLNNYNLAARGPR
jgi:hypothetical protein